MNRAPLATASHAPSTSRARRTDGLPAIVPAPYTVKLATTTQEFRAALRLRYEVFNLEMSEGLESSHATAHDFDSFDAVVDHIIVKCAWSERVVGTYRLQTGATAERHLGYYSEREFNFRPFEPLRREVLELGRACIHQEHRNTQVLMLLWKAITQYGIQRGCRYLLGCSSVNTQDPAAGTAVYHKLKKFLAPPELRTMPQPAYRFDVGCVDASGSQEAGVPKLLRAYLTVGAQICGPPALDR
jgi:putative hemolysin